MHLCSLHSAKLTATTAQADRRDGQESVVSHTTAQLATCTVEGFELQRTSLQQTGSRAQACDLTQLPTVRVSNTENEMQQRIPVPEDLHPCSPMTALQWQLRMRWQVWVANTCTSGTQPLSSGISWGHPSERTKPTSPLVGTGLLFSSINYTCNKELLSFPFNCLQVLVLRYSHAAEQS